MLFRLLTLFMLLSLGLADARLTADDTPSASSAEQAASAQTPKPPRWWEKRDKPGINLLPLFPEVQGTGRTGDKPTAGIHYPHRAHFKIMEQEGDSCLLCHGFGPNTLTDKKQLKSLTTIANEPLRAVCHDCHVDERRGPWRCDLCHDDRTRIWPVDHNYSYIDHHGEAGRRDEAACRECHLDLSFCTNCHLRRDTAGQGYHPLGYRSLHGLEARIDTLSCGRCHNTPYCDECHRASR